MRFFTRRSGVWSTSAARLRSGEPDRNAGIARSLACFFAHREFPRCVLLCALAGEVADSGFKARTIILTGLQQHRIREEPPSGVSNLVNPGWYLLAGGISQRKVSAIHAAHRLGEKDLHHGILIGFLRAGRWVYS